MTKNNLIGFIENNGSYAKRKNKSASTKGIQIPKAVSEAEGFFGSESMHWKIYREPGIIVAGVSALLQQIAHPAVAEAVKIYSQYQSDFLGRAHRTILSMTRIWFGSRSEAVQSAKRLYQIHSHIRGVYTRHQNGSKQVIPYCATDPDLLLWILATMNKATIDAYEKIYRPLAPREKELYYKETKITAQLMGIPIDLYPRNWLAFNIYYKGILSSNLLEVGETAGAISEDLFAAYFPFTPLVNGFTSGFLPKKLRQQFGLTHRKFWFNLLTFMVKISLKIIPSFLSYAPHYYLAKYRLAKAQNKRPSLLACWHNWVANTIRLPLFSNKLNPKR